MLSAAGVAEVIERAFNLREEICHSGADCCPWLSPATPRPTRVNYFICNREKRSPTPADNGTRNTQPQPGLPSAWLWPPSSSHVPKRGLTSPNLGMRVVNSAKGSLIFWISFVHEGSLVLSWQRRWKVDTGTPWFST